jgi:hypothetical protein
LALPNSWCIEGDRQIYSVQAKRWDWLCRKVIYIYYYSLWVSAVLGWLLRCNMWMFMWGITISLFCLPHFLCQFDSCNTQ